MCWLLNTKLYHIVHRLREHSWGSRLRAPGSNGRWGRAAAATGHTEGVADTSIATAGPLPQPLAQGVDTATTQIILSGHLLYSIICSRFTFLGRTSPLAKIRVPASMHWLPGCWERNHLTSWTSSEARFCLWAFSPHSKGVQKSFRGQFG